MAAISWASVSIAAALVVAASIADHYNSEADDCAESGGVYLHSDHVCIRQEVVIKKDK